MSSCYLFRLSLQQPPLFLSISVQDLLFLCSAHAVESFLAQHFPSSLWLLHFFMHTLSILIQVESFLTQVESFLLQVDSFFTGSCAKMEIALELTKKAITRKTTNFIM